MKILALLEVDEDLLVQPYIKKYMTYDIDVYDAFYAEMGWAAQSGISIVSAREVKDNEDSKILTLEV